MNTTFATADTTTRCGRSRAIASRAAVVLGALVTMALTSIGSASAVVTVDRAGSFGSLVSSSDALCWGGGFDASSITAPATTVTRAPTNTRANQTIWALHRLDYWTGSQWSTYRWGTWQGVVTAPGQNARFSGQTLPISGLDLRNGYRIYRVATVYQWQVGQTTIGKVTNHYETGDYSVSYSTLSFIPFIGNATPGYSSWCGWPSIAV